MGKKEIAAFLSSRILLLDGAVGTELIKRGHGDTPPELSVLKFPNQVEKIQHAFALAGSDILLTATLGANSLKLREAGFADKMAEINKQAVAIARKAALPNTLIAGNLGPTGALFPPSGSLSFETCYRCYQEEAKVLADQEIDLFILETFFDIRELKAAALSIRDEVPEAFIIANLTFDKNGRTLTGTDPTGFALAFEDLDIDALGVNCSIGPEEMIPIFQELARTSSKFLSAKPNAGVPEIVHDKPQYRMDPKTFGKFAEDFIDLGVNFIGGCCGTGPEHIQFLAEQISKRKPLLRATEPLVGISSLSRNVILGNRTAPVIIGERINPTGKKRMTAELEMQASETILHEAKKQAKAGAQVLDLNLGMETGIPGPFVQDLITQLLAAPALPLSLDLRSGFLIEAALQAYGGRALLNSITYADMEEKVPLLIRYGGMVVFLPIDEQGIPLQSQERVKLAEKAVERLHDMGIKKERILFDPIVMSLSTGNDPNVTLGTLKTFRKKGYHTVLGLSNISYGLPHRSVINRYFLNLCNEIGADAVIMNPSDAKTEIDIDLSPVFSGGKSIKDFITEVTVQAHTPTVAEREDTDQGRVFNAIIEGEKNTIVQYLESLLKTISFELIIEETLRPALDEVGKRYERREIFLPQLIMAAETAQVAFGYIEKRFAQKNKGKGKVIIATVKGDLHDIGKNIVSMMLKNAGFAVTDLGKDVPSAEIIQEAMHTEADIIALSALMTTTAMRMKEVIELAKKETLSAKVMIGGACITKKFADEINADAFAGDAAEAVKEARRLLENTS